MNIHDVYDTIYIAEWDSSGLFTVLHCIYRDNFGEELVDTEKAKKEERTGPHEEMTLGEFIDVRILIIK